MREPHRLMVRSAICHRARIHIAQIKRLLAPPAQGREVLGLQGEQRALVNRLVEKPIARNAFQLQRTHKGRTRNVVRLVRKIFEHEAVGREARNAWFRLQQFDRRVILQSRFEVLYILFARSRLLRQALQLRPQHRSLQLAQPVIKSNNAVMILIRQTGAPCVDIALHQLHVFSVLVITAPPSPEVISLLDWKLNAPKSPIEPAPCPFHIAPCACAQSSITFKLCFFAMRKISSMSAKRIPRWTGRIAFVFGVMACSISFVSRQYVSGSTSTQTGTALSSSTGPTVPSHVYAGTITSSPGRI